MKNKATVKILLDPQSKEIEKPIKLRITYNRISRFRAIPVDIKLRQEEFENEKLKKTKEALSVARKALAIAETICEELGGNFTWVTFDLQYKKAVWDKSISTEIDDWDKLLQDYFKKKNLKRATKINYITAVKWVQEFSPNATITDITPEFIEGLKSYMIKTHKKNTNEEMSCNTIGMYLRGLRAVYNFAVSKKIIEDTKPFARQIESAPRQKRAFANSDWQKFISFKPTPNTQQEFAHDFAILIFALCGTNITDILSLKNNNINNNNTISFTRGKTARFDTQITIPIVTTAKNIIEKYGVINLNNPNTYIFPYFNDTMSEKTIYNKRSTIVKRINKGIADICNILNIEKFTTYNIRHFFAVTGRDSKNLSVEQLQLLLGHKNIKTTQIYLNSITNELIKDTDDFINNILNI